jgi:hypothetical protein
MEISQQDKIRLIKENNDLIFKKNQSMINYFKKIDFINTQIRYLHEQNDLLQKDFKKHNTNY